MCSCRALRRMVGSRPAWARIIALCAFAVAVALSACAAPPVPELPTPYVATSTPLPPTPTSFLAVGTPPASPTPRPTPTLSPAS